MCDNQGNKLFEINILGHSTSFEFLQSIVYDGLDLSEFFYFKFTNRKVIMAKKLSMMINANHPEMCRAVILEDGRVNDYVVENTSQEKIK